MKKLTFFLVVVLLVGGGILLVKKRASEINAISARKRPMPRVETATVRSGDFIEKRRFVGVLEPDRKADITSRVQASVSRVFYREGDTVKKGDLLMELDTLTGNRKALQGRLRALEEQLKNSGKIIANLRETLRRDRVLYGGGAISKEQYQITENRLLEAESARQSIVAQVEEVKATLALYSIYAPYDGVVVSVPVREGDIVLPGRPVMKIESVRGFRITVRVDSETLRGIRKGFLGTVYHKQERLILPVSRVYPSLVDGTGMVELHLGSRPFGLPTGSYLDVDLETRRLSSVLIIPEKSLLELAGEAVVYRIERNRISRVQVKVLGKSNALVAVKGPLAGGDNVVLGTESLLLRLADSMEVAVR